MYWQCCTQESTSFTVGFGLVALHGVKLLKYSTVPSKFRDPLYIFATVHAGESHKFLQHGAALPSSSTFTAI